MAGVRFKAWKPSEAPHPSLPLQTPLVFDLFDRFTETIIDGSRYHVAHPGVEIIKKFPINEYEAQARELARFEADGQTAATYTIPKGNSKSEFLLTLDLREDC